VRCFLICVCTHAAHTSPATGHSNTRLTFVSFLLRCSLSGGYTINYLIFLGGCRRANVAMLLIWWALGGGGEGRGYFWAARPRRYIGYSPSTHKGLWHFMASWHRSFMATPNPSTHKVLWCFVASRLHHNLVASQPSNLVASQPHNLTTSQPHNLTTSQPRSLVTSYHSVDL
jgi:hypothetical protein